MLLLQPFCFYIPVCINGIIGAKWCTTAIFRFVISLSIQFDNVAFEVAHNILMLHVPRAAAMFRKVQDGLPGLFAVYRFQPNRRAGALPVWHNAQYLLRALPVPRYCPQPVWRQKYP
jgi:hypothetical protein